MKEKIIAILNSLRPEFDFSKPAHFIEQGMLDSFDVINLVNELETEFGITINGIDILPENFSTLDHIIALVKRNGVE